MKALTCEMCGSTNLIKEGGVFVCQSCGTKYSVEEAKKMMVEGTVDVKGTVKVDTSDELNNLYEIARRAKDSDNSENAMSEITEDAVSGAQSIADNAGEGLQSAGEDIKNAAENAADNVRDGISDAVSDNDENDNSQDSSES